MDVVSEAKRRISTHIPTNAVGVQRNMKKISFPAPPTPVLQPIVVTALPTVQTDPKYCVNCKHFIINPNFPKDNSRGRCTAFPFEDYMLEPPINPVSGELEGELEYHEKFYACSSARALEQKCGKDGKRFMPKDPTGGDSKSFGT